MSRISTYYPSSNKIIYVPSLFEENIKLGYVLIHSSTLCYSLEKIILY